MKYLTNLTFIMLMFIFTSCSTGGNHPDYASNVEKIKTFLELQGSESDSQAQADMIHEDVQWQPAFYGTAPIGKAEFVEYLIAWQDAMEDVVYTPTNYLPGVNAETGELIGAHMIGPEVTELISTYCVAMQLEATELDLFNTIFPHPTISESIHESVLDAYDRAIHI